MSYKYRLMYSIILISMMLIIPWELYSQKSTSMTYTTRKAQGATKNWDADTCFAEISASKILKITGRIPTGRTDLPTQDMVISISDFRWIGQSETYSIYDAYFQEIYTIAGKPRYKNAEHDRIRGGNVTITGVDEQKGLIKGNFDFYLRSEPPVGDPFLTQVYEGKFEAFAGNAFNLEVSPTKEVKSNAGNKVNFKLYVSNFIGKPVADADVIVSDQIGKVTSKVVGKTNAVGEYVYTVDIPKDTKTDEYKVFFRVEKKNESNELIKSETVERDIEVSSRYWLYTCGLISYTFDAGEGNEWKSDDPQPTISATGQIVINDVLTCDGTVTIDPREGYEKFYGNYIMYIDNVNIANSFQRFLIGSKFALALNCGDLKWDAPNVLTKKIGGYTFSLDEVSFKDLGFAKGVKLKGTVVWDNKLQENCTNNSNQPENQSVTFGLLIAYEELVGFRIEALEFALTNFTFENTKLFCIDNFNATYDAVTDGFSIFTAMEFKPNVTKWFKGDNKIKAFFQVINGRFDSLTFEWKTKPGVNLPDPRIPFTWNGLKISTGGWADMTGLSSKPFSLSGFFNSIDGSIKAKVPFFEKLLGEAPVCEVELGGQYDINKHSIKGFGIMKLFENKSISVFEKWQVELSGEINFMKDGKWNVFAQGFLKAFHFGLKDYFIKSRKSIDFELLIEEPIGFTVNMDAELRIPDLPSDPPSGKKGALFKLLEKLKAAKVFPRTLGYGLTRFFMGPNIPFIELSGYFDVTSCGIPIISSYGKLAVGFDIYPPCLAYPKFGDSFEDVVSTKTQKKPDDQIQSEDGSEFVKAESQHTFNISDKQQRFFIMIQSDTKTPKSHLLTPSGDKIIATKQDSSIILFDVDDTFAQWTVKNPDSGNWKLEIENPKAGDSVYIFGLNKERAFEIQALAKGKEITVTWDGSGYSTGDYVEVFIDKNNSELGGRLQGKANASDGTYTFTLNDSLSECSYFVYAYRGAAGYNPEVDYFENPFSVDKSWLPAPESINLESDQQGNCILSFAPVQKPDIYQYAVYVEREGRDSLIASAYPNEQIIQFQCDTSLLSTLHIVAVNPDGINGCPAYPEKITVGLFEESVAAGIPLELGLSVAPNPALNSAEIRLNLPESSYLTLAVYDLLGNRIMDIAGGYYNAGIFKTHLNAAALNSGTYILKLGTDKSIKSELLIISK